MNRDLLAALLLSATALLVGCGPESWPGGYQLPDGAVYQGELRDNLFHGKGTLTWPDGRRYEGEFVNGVMQGQGRLLDEKGCVYEGAFANGLPEGEGRYECEDVLHEGTFVDGDIIEGGYHQRRRQRAEQIEQRLYSEERRLQRALTALSPQEPRRRDIYVLLVGGDGRQAVFSREVQWVAERLGAHWEPRGHVLTLANSQTGDAPLATRTSLRESLETLNAIADPDEDLVFVHLVSHGGDSGDLLLEQPGLALNDVSPTDVAAWLDAMPPRYLWLVVSACYSGHWIEPLANRRRLIFTAASADRTPFGCGDDSRRTWFSEALYGAALDDNGLDDPEAWFDAARKAIATMEAEQGIEANLQSRPRAHFGKAFLGWWRQP